MDSFPENTLTELKAHLTEEKHRLEARIKELSTQDPFTDPDRGIDNAASDTEASEESNHDRVSAIVSELTRQAADVDAALTRIEEGKYGYCVSCGNMIDTDRLAIFPTATLCVTCEAKKKK